MSREEEEGREKATRERDVENGPAEKGPQQYQGEEGQQQQHQQLDNISSTLFHNQVRFHQAVATGLIVTYFIEIILQIFLIVLCCRSFIFLTSAWWDWPFYIGLSFLLSSIVVAVVSIVWVCRGDLDFDGRLCGRLLCYVMHSLLLGLLWRYLKLAFVYDRADVQEFVVLRIFQTFFQSLPLTSIHLAWLIVGSRENWSNVTFGIVLVEFLSVLTALILSSYIKSEDQRLKSKGEVMEIMVKNLNCPTPNSNNNPTLCKTTMTDKETSTTKPKMPATTSALSLWPQFFEPKLHVLSRSLLLGCRLLVVALAIVHFKYWTCMFLLIHFIVSFTWISFCVNNDSSISRKSLLEEMEEVSLTKGKDFVTLVTEWSYILFWDVTATITTYKTINTILLPVILAMLENGAMILFHWYREDRDDSGRIVTIVSSSCLLLGWLLFSSLNFLSTYRKVTKCCSQHNLHDHHHHQHHHHHHGHYEKEVGEDKGGQTPQSCLSVIDPMTMKNPQTNNTHHHTMAMAIPRGSDEKSILQPSNNMQQSQWNGSSNNYTKKGPAWDLSLFSNSTPTALPNNYYNNINEVLVTRTKQEAAKQEKTLRNGRKSKTSSPEAPEGLRSTFTNPSQSPVLHTPISQCQNNTNSLTTTATTTTWVPDCCNDSNGSSNSRNTNTLRETGNAIIPDIDIENDTDIENANFVFYFPTDTSVQHSVASNSGRFPRGGDEPNFNGNSNNRPRNRTSTGSYRKSKKKSRSSSVSSFGNVRRYRTSTPIEIKQASRIVVNNPYNSVPRTNSNTNSNSEVKTNVNNSSSNNSNCVSNRCYCYVESKKSCQTEKTKEKEQLQRSSPLQTQSQTPIQNQHQNQSQQQLYEKLIEDSYGILICEGESSSSTMYNNNNNVAKNISSKNKELIHSHNHPSNHSHPQNHRHQSHPSSSSTPNVRHHPSIFHASRKIKVLCAKCLQNHDPLLTNCLETEDNVNVHVKVNEDLLHSLSQEDRSQILLALGPSPSSQHYPHPLLSSLLLPSSSSVPPPIRLFRQNYHSSSNRNSVEDDDEDYNEDEENLNDNNNHLDKDNDNATEEHHLPSDTTDYPSETEMTCTLEEDDDDQLSVSTNLSTATYTTWPHRSSQNPQSAQQNPHQNQNRQQLSMWTTSTMMPQSRFPKEFTSLEYVRTWLLTSQARHNLWQNKHYSNNNSNSNGNNSHTIGHSRNKSAAAKKVCRAQTMSHGRRVRFVGADASAVVGGSSQATRKSLGAKQRQEPNSSGQHSRTGQQSFQPQPAIPLAFQPPPRQKQHPVLPPHSAHIAHTNCHNNSNTISNSNNNSCSKGTLNESSSDLFYKDVEIIL